MDHEDELTQRNRGMNAAQKEVHKTQPSGKSSLQTVPKDFLHDAINNWKALSVIQCWQPFLVGDTIDFCLRPGHYIRILGHHLEEGCHYCRSLRKGEDAFLNVLSRLTVSNPAGER